ncbi:MAG: response regulator transcription factor [Leptolyngbya sp.]|nr:response regulator transcription factor [Candidatus Melainabacteria bacterium]
MAKILVVEDDQDLTTMIRDLLVYEKHTVEIVHCGEDAREHLKMSNYDILILDWTLPDATGVEILKDFRAAGGLTPAIFLTGRSAVADKEVGLDSGADDYLTKPFHMRELSARVRALLRRPARFVHKTLKIRNIELFPLDHKILRDGVEVKLHPKEFALLEFLMRHPSQIFSGEALLSHVWRSDSTASIDTVRQSLARLRQGIDSEKSNPLIRTIYGVGYKLEP